MSENAFFQDLAMLMAAAGVVAAAFARLRWPKVIGYILAGVVMSEHTWGGSFLAHPSSAGTIGQLGIVFLHSCDRHLRVPCPATAAAVAAQEREAIC